MELRGDAAIEKDSAGLNFKTTRMAAALADAPAERAEEEFPQKNKLRLPV